eukprot:360826-Chlamydomonas_euryale.AAC.5
MPPGNACCRVVHGYHSHTDPHFADALQRKHLVSRFRWKSGATGEQRTKRLCAHAETTTRIQVPAHKRLGRLHTCALSLRTPAMDHELRAMLRPTTTHPPVVEPLGRACVALAAEVLGTMQQERDCFEHGAAVCSCKGQRRVCSGSGNVAIKSMGMRRRSDRPSASLVAAGRSGQGQGRGQGSGDNPRAMRACRGPSVPACDSAAG